MRMVTLGRRGEETLRRRWEKWIAGHTTPRTAGGYLAGMTPTAHAVRSSGAARRRGLDMETGRAR